MSRRVLRFNRTERLYHWVQGLPFLVLLATGGLLLGQRLFRVALVDPALLIGVHRVAGVLLPVGLLLVVVGGDREALLANARLALRWRRADLDWLLRFPLHELSRRVAVPPAGRFNAGQKLNLVAQMVLVPTFLATGLVMWFYRGVLVAWWIHVAAFLVASPLIAGHLYLALVHPSTRKGLPGVVSGRVDAAWAREHYPLEYGDDGEGAA